MEGPFDVPYIPAPEDSPGCDCSQHGGESMADLFSVPGDKGPWFEAWYEVECSGCFREYYNGDLIRADGEGGYEAKECCGE